jgi:hypothetical protein
MHRSLDDYPNPSELASVLYEILDRSDLYMSSRYTLFDCLDTLIDIEDPGDTDISFWRTNLDKISKKIEALIQNAEAYQGTT